MRSLRHTLPQYVCHSPVSLSPWGYRQMKKTMHPLEGVAYEIVSLSVGISASPCLKKRSFGTCVGGLSAVGVFLGGYCFQVRAVNAENWRRW